MRTIKQIKQEDGVNSLKAINIQFAEAKNELAAPATCKHGVNIINVCTDCLRDKFGIMESSPGSDADVLRERRAAIGPPYVLDACCGSRMFWFDRADGRALFVDKRRETCVADTREGRREIIINPNQLADFKNLPFRDATFSLVVFDPPHTTAGPNSWTRKKYGTLAPDWRKEISFGFAECFRVLCPLGTLIFKWNEHRVPVSIVLSLTPEKPLFGQRCGTTARTHWIVFLKPKSE